MKRQLGVLIIALLMTGCGSDSKETSTPSIPSEPDTGTETGSDNDQQGNASNSCELSGLNTGEATYYDATGIGNCSFEATTDDMMVAALNTTDYGTAEWCGACAEVRGPLGNITVKIVDRCPGCAPGDIDLSGTAFAQIANPADGRVPISWKFVACDIEGDVSLRFATGSNQWWSGVQVRNHIHPIASLEYRGNAGEFIPIERRRHNYFVASDGMGTGPISFRVTDSLGQQIVINDMALIPDLDQSTGEQFAACN